MSSVTFSCRQFLQHLSDWVDQEMDPGLSEEMLAAIRSHASSCPHCEVLIDTTRQSLQLLGRLSGERAGDERLFPLPALASQRLHDRLEAELQLGSTATSAPATAAATPAPTPGFLANDGKNDGKSGDKSAGKSDFRSTANADGASRKHRAKPVLFLDEAPQPAKKWWEALPSLRANALAAAMLLLVAGAVLWLSRATRAQTYTGYLVDVHCAADLAAHPEQHKAACLLAPQCRRTGYGLETAGGHYLPLGQKGTEIAYNLVKAHPERADHLWVKVQGRQKNGKLQVQAMEMPPLNQPESGMVGSSELTASNDALGN